MITHPTGKGVLVWQVKRLLETMSPAEIAEKAVEAGFSWVSIKLAGGYADYNQDYALPVVAALKNAGVQVWGWHYIYGLSVKNAGYEAKAAIRNIARYDLTGWMPDPEREYKEDGSAAWAAAYMAELRTAYPSLPIGLCSYRYPSYHRELPWYEFLNSCTFHAPQVYWIQAHNPATQLQLSMKQLLTIKNLPFVPVGASFTEAGWQPTLNDLDEFDAEAHRLNLPGVGWYLWDGAAGLSGHPTWWNVISSHQWAPPAPPAQDWHWALDKWARTLGYDGPEPR